MSGTFAATQKATGHPEAAGGSSMRAVATGLFHVRLYRFRLTLPILLR